MSLPRAARWSLALALTGALIAAALFLTTPRSRPFYTDASTIRASEDLAVLRDILWQPPEELGAPLNTPEGDEYEPALSVGGLTLLFVRGKPGANADLYQSVRSPEGWSEPAPITELNTEADELGPALSADGRTLYFYSDREGSLGGYDLWRSERREDSWSEPVNLGLAVNSPFNEYSPALDPRSERLYFASNRPRVGEPVPERDSASWPATIRESFQNRPYDLYLAPLTEQGLGAAQIIESLSTPHSEGTPRMSPAGDFLYFSSDRPGGMGGFDLYRARLVNDAFFNPEHLGDGVNTDANELDPALDLAGFGLLFSSDRDTGAGRRYDLYRTESREVYKGREPLAAIMSWPELIRLVGPWLLLLALLAALLALLRRLATDDRWKARWRKLGLMAKCLIVSGLVHTLILLLMTLWQVSSHMGDLLGSPGGTKVHLVSSAVGGSIESLIRADVAPLAPAPAIELAPAPAMEVAVPSFEPITPERFESPALAAVTDISVAPSITPTQRTLQRTEAQPTSAPLPSSELSSTPEVALPAHRAREAIAEASLTESTPTHLAAGPEAEFTPLPAALMPETIDLAQPTLPSAIDTAPALRIDTPTPRGPSPRSSSAASDLSALDDSSPTDPVALPELASAPRTAPADEPGIGEPEPAIPETREASVAIPMNTDPGSVALLSAPQATPLPESDAPAFTPAPATRSIERRLFAEAATDPGLFELDVALPQGVSLPEEVAVPRSFTGVVLDAQTGQPIEDALVRIDSDRGDLVESRTDTSGAFAMEPEFEADFVAVTASKPGYTPHALNLPIEELERGVVREIRLEPIRDTVIALEEEPEVHHLGDNDFGGRINSQFQKESEGITLTAEFTLTEAQHAALGDIAAVTLLAKGLQAENIVRINGREFPHRLSSSPSDGSFGQRTLGFDASWLRAGPNTLEIESVVSAGRDHDDFEVVNIQILLAPPVQQEERPRRSRPGTL